MRWMVEHGEHFDVIPVESGVLDMSNRGDIASVVEALSSHEVRL